MYPDLEFNIHFLVYPSSFYAVQYKAVKMIRNTEFSTKTRRIQRGLSRQRGALLTQRI